MSECQLKEDQFNLYTENRLQYESKLLAIIEQLNQNTQKFEHPHEFVIQYLRQFKFQAEYQDQTLKSVNINQLFPNRLWEFDLTETFISKIRTYYCIPLMLILSYLLQGRFNEENKEYTKILYLNCGSLKLPFQYAFVASLFPLDSLQIIVLILPEKQYITNSSGQLEQIKFIHKMRFIDSINESYGNNDYLIKQSQTILDDNLHQQLKSNDVLLNIKLIKEKQRSCHISSEIKIGIKTRNRNLLISPRSFETIKLDSQLYIFDDQTKTWMTKKLYESIQKKIMKINAQTADYYLIKEYICLPSASQISKLISKLPKFKNKITEQQLQAIVWKGITFILGRSGTGKTTCALFKVFILDALFNLRQQLKTSNAYINSQIKQETQSQQYLQKDKLTLKILFVTASPLLAWQIKQNYLQLIENFQELIKDKFQKKPEEQAESNEMEEESFYEIINELQESQAKENNSDTDEDEMDDYEKKMGRFQKLSDITEYPAFLTLRKLIFSIDASLLNPYFKFTQTQHCSAQWHNEQIGIVSLNQSSQHSCEKLQKKIKDYDDKEFIVYNNTQEVTFDLFLNWMWPKIVKKIEHQNQDIKKLDPALVWYEIMSKIKGHATSYEYPNKYMNYDNYSYYHKVLSDEYTKLLYKAFENYEMIKQNVGYYDLLDVVNHINYELQYGNDVLENVHYLILDELQDIPNAIFILLNSIADFGLICCGDNAQNIQKGTGQQFVEYRNLLNDSNLKKKYRNNEISTFKLPQNFRFHDQILQLTNSLIRMIELLFPYKIDVFDKEERSCLQGPKPIVIQSEDQQILLNYLQKNFKIESNQIAFGSNQVIIVRDQESKPKVPDSLQQTLILTIYEAKGLEFDDVILFNFFTDSDCTSDDWNILKNFQIKDVDVKIKQDQNVFLVHEFIYSIEMKKLFLIPNTQQQNLSDNIDKFVNYQTLCQELKLLYVALSRAKRQIIIYDNNYTKRKTIQKLWEDLQVIEVIYTTQIEDAQEFEILFSQQFDNKNNWRNQGLNFFRVNNYEQAKRCFKFAKDYQLEKKAQAYQLATQATLTENAEHLFYEAALIFEELNIQNRAAQCYFSAKKYKNAYRLYKQLNAKMEMAEAAYFCREYEEAGQLFLEVKDLRRSIESYIQQGNYNKVVELILKHQDDLSKEEYQIYLTKYFPIVLQQILDGIEIQNEVLANEIEEQSESFQVCNSELSQRSEKLEFKFRNSKQSRIENQSSFSESFQVINSDSFDHLSSYDPDDEWIQNDKVQLISSIASIDVQSLNENKILLLNQVELTSFIKNQNKTVTLNDSTLIQIIQLLGQISEDFKIHIQQKFGNQLDYSKIIKTIDIDTIKLTLSLLEKFQNYKLCIYICNQYKLLHQIGEYLVILASKYTPIYKNSMRVDTQMIRNTLKRKHLLDQASIAHQALQNIFDAINPEILKFKYEDYLDCDNSFGLKCYQDLIGLGFWKQIIFQMNYQNSKDLCLSFNNHSDLISILQHMKKERGDNSLKSDQKFQLMKSQYLLQVEQFFIDKKIKLVQIDQIFQITNSITQGDIINFKKINQIICNAKLKEQNLDFENKLRQLESIILSYLLCCGIISSEDATLEQRTNLINILYYCINQVKSIGWNQNLIDAIQFLFKFSFPQGEIMNNYSQYVLLNVQSKLLKNIKNEQIYFADSSFEYLMIPFEQLLIYISNYFGRTNIQELKSFEYQQDLQQNCQTPLAFIIKQIKHQQLQSVLWSCIQHNINLQNQLKKQKDSTINNSIEQDEYSILSVINESGPKQFYDYLLKTNQNSVNLAFSISTSVIYQCTILFQQAFKSFGQEQHAYLILAINLSNFSNNLPLAIYSIQSIEEKSQIKKYLKYIEFLECQNYNITEDLVACFLDYCYFCEQNLYLDEWSNHLIRIGLKLILAQDVLTTIVIPDYYLEFLDQDVENEYTVKQNTEFPLKNYDVMIEYLNCLSNYIQSSNSPSYESSGYLLLIVITLNLFTIPKELQTIIKNIFSPYNVKPQLKNIASCLNSNLESRRAKLISEEELLIVTDYLDEKFISLQVIQNKVNDNQNITMYQDCLDKWDLHLQLAEKFRIYGKRILQSYLKHKQYIKKNSKVELISNPKIVRFIQYYQLPSSVLKCVNYDKNWKSQLIYSYKLQDELLRTRVQSRTMKDIQQIRIYLESVINLQLELKKGHYIQDQLTNVERLFREYQESKEKEQMVQQSMLERNREMLRIKWQNVQAGIKVQNKLSNTQKKQCIRIQEQDEEEEMNII
ncbi:unnamed protein product (macronuclear) [Paramecium tetraurelia]|uniref:UvrD-like helicase ATP-binding domain-containing protein n=1 Tax=Paramecium tetraurelia TaxID=5888 RepID=A0BQK8_PARTE|nr:uncharacterized protein GSPATT00031054001 [Paramecium tetraurelia]CAK60825.1 unnamed protein product [Paramecium tetraurelia]|eukprot:XP_001428223.1 hypothetical protein (macronuclear) [Paramecium tetraurelia strain d4-2]